MERAAYLQIPDIKGSARRNDVMGKIAVAGVSHQINSVLDTVTGEPTGKVKHQALIVTKECDVASPRLYQAMEEGRTFDKVQLDFFRMPDDGGDDNYASVVMEGVRVAFIRLVMPNNLKMENQELPAYEEVGLAYQRIQWKWHASVGYEGERETAGTGSIEAAFATPLDVERRKLAFDLLKSAIVGTATATIKALKALTPAPDKPPGT